MTIMTDILSQVNWIKRYCLMTVVFVFYSTIIILIIRHQIIDGNEIPQIIDENNLIDTGPLINISELIWTTTDTAISVGTKIDSTTGTYYDPAVARKYSLALVKKEEWSKSKWKNRCLRMPLTLPVSTVYVIESQTPNCLRYLECSEFVSEVQNNDTTLYGDIQYNFVVTGQGSIFEGLSWDCAVHNDTVATDAILVLLTGYSMLKEYYVNVKQYDSLQVFLQYNVMMRKLSPTHSLRPVCCIVPGNNPGKNLYWDLATKFNRIFDYHCDNPYNCTDT